MKAFLVAFMVIPAILGAPQQQLRNIFLDNLSPEQAQRFLQDDDDKLSYAPKLGEEPLQPSGRSLDGRQYWYNGRRIEDPQNYVESTFLANQYHGQDGLGKAKFGYKDWNQAHKQNIHGDGTVKGSYQFTYPNGRVHKVNYYADSQGFHQVDNRPKHEIEPVTDTPAVKAAKEAHFKAWHEAAAANKAAGYTEGQYHEDYARYKDVTGPPHGFYYEFDYPVHLIEPNHARSAYNSEENGNYNGNSHGNYNPQYNNYQRSGAIHTTSFQSTNFRSAFPNTNRIKRDTDHHHKSPANSNPGSVSVKPAVDSKTAIDSRAPIDGIHDAQVSIKQKP